MASHNQPRFPWLTWLLWATLFSGLCYGLYLQEGFIPSDYILAIQIGTGVVLSWFLTLWTHIRASNREIDPLSYTSISRDITGGVTPYGAASSSAERAAWYDLMRAVGAETGVEKTLRLMLPAMQRLFPGSSVALYVRTAMDSLTLQLRIGDESTGPNVLHMSECEGMEKGRTFIRLSSIYTCAHHQLEKPALLACVPIAVDDRYLGLLTLTHPLPEDRAPLQEEYDDLENRLLSIAAMLSLYLHNQTLKGTLLQNTIRDSLTGLFNRRYMEETLTREFAEAKRRKAPIGVIVVRPLDINKIHETHGHKAADHLLWEIGQRLPGYIRTEDIPCRLDENKFCVIMPGADRRITHKRAQKIFAELSALHVVFQGKTLESQVALGVAVFPEDAASVHGLITAAVQASSVSSGGARS